MAKKLLKFYTFDASERTITVPDNIMTEELLVITNVTDNIIIYNFADPSKGTTNRSYTTDGDNGETTFTLAYDTTSMSDTDDLQIFIDYGDLVVTFDDTFVDPVSKLRVSNPNTLIDTDFEYGPQSTKWETLELINNIPAFFTRSGSFITDIFSVIAEESDAIVTVTTETDHGLAAGDPFDIRDLTNRDALGSYVVLETPTTTTFTYQARAEIGSSDDLKTAQTTVNKGKFFSVSDLKLKQDTAVLHANSTNITIDGNQIVVSAGHPFANGMPVLWIDSLGYSNSDTDGAISGLTSNQVYYIGYVNSTAFTLNEDRFGQSFATLGGTTTSTSAEYGSFAELQGVSFTGSGPYDLIARVIPSRPLSNNQAVTLINNTIANADGSFVVSDFFEDNAFYMANATSNALSNQTFSWTSTTATVNAEIGTINIPGHELAIGQMISLLCCTGLSKHV